ncbi:hypothetical protein TWF225_003838 [Orbilia oligospora]|uniref:Uncharacterized protein n=1 Tax=Orbilia oligospora TaxID=2813651 RepID=A0A7C8PTJ7_ORBOL|nr:hypothetical protein TWF103_003804 [Orbilia oligospora]KAF3115614.1 hypothetical protein TWF706_005730 [Orbilia oligospora]KAF3179006.1 hypothetical protein TWF751_001015 [Orbilia oligospora]KAF3188061.1 hypothetical protein TWF225_003838 [Orbilia oligospora]KAF3248563.1 hypothetical protein TWF128_008285 [Orbilia oligospora]
MPTLLSIPAELRNQIYTYLLSPYNNREPLEDGSYTYEFFQSLVIFRINRQIYLESRKIFHQLNTFVKISTPWQQAKYHVALDGQVDILDDTFRAEKFRLHTLSVQINAVYPSPEAMEDPQAMFSFIILLETGDLDRFCRSWFYSSVTMPYLNSHLILNIGLQDPYISSSPFPIPGEPHVSKQKQSQLLQPFGQIKDLREFHINGNITVYPSVRKALKTEMETPLDSPETCLERGTELKDLGNEALMAGKYTEAIKLYNKAFHAIHIVINARTRRVYGDPFFDKIIRTPGPFKDQHAGQARILLRVRLVANTILAYLKLQDYDMALLTGMRTIRLMRASIGLDEDNGALDAAMEALSGFIASGEMGKIYFRTAMAYKALNRRMEAYKLLAVASVYLPNDKTIKQELEASTAKRA